jgi:hypothetical protein
MLLAKEIADHKKTSRELFTFEFIKDAIRAVFPGSFEQLTLDLVKMLAFDALVGNNDRHFYNWGVIATKKKISILPTFAPVYDSARGLLWNRSDDNIINLLRNHKNGSKKVLNYIQEACPRISIESNTEANHFELMDFIVRYNDEYRQIIKEFACTENEEKVLKMLRKEFFPFFICERSELITLILKTRFKKVRGILI